MQLAALQATSMQTGQQLGLLQGAIAQLNSKIVQVGGQGLGAGARACVVILT